MLIFNILPEVFISYAATLLNFYFGFMQEVLKFIDMVTFAQNMLCIFETIIFPISPGNFSMNVPNPFFTGLP